MAEFVAALSLVVIVFLVVAEVAIYLYVRNVAISAAHEGARLGAEVGRHHRDGAALTRRILADTAGGYVRHLRVTSTLDAQRVVVEVSGEVPLSVPLVGPIALREVASVSDEEALIR